MSFSDSNTYAERTTRIPVQLPNGMNAAIEVAQVSAQEDVSFIPQKPLLEIGQMLEGVVQAVYEPIQKVAAKKVMIKFGIELAVESGQLTAVIVKGSGKANLEISLEW